MLEICWLKCLYASSVPPSVASMSLHARYRKTSIAATRSFPIIDQTAEKFVEGLKGSSTEAVVRKVGKTISI